MRNPWRMQDGPDIKINRNNFPMSFQYNGTFKYGKIYPVGLIRTIPGASYQIDSTLALNFMPTSFPIQTRQRAYVHFFYGRDRNFWKDYKDFVNGMNPDLVKPYLDESVTQARTGNLLDYLGVPTTLVGDYGNDEVIASSTLFNSIFDYIDNSIRENINLTQSPYVYPISNLYQNLEVGNTISLSERNPSSVSYNGVYVQSLPLPSDSLERIKSIGIQTGLDSVNENMFSIDAFLNENTPSSTISNGESYNAKCYFTPLGSVTLKDLFFIVVVDENNVITYTSPLEYKDNGYFSVKLNDYTLNSNNKVYVYSFGFSALYGSSTSSIETRIYRAPIAFAEDPHLIFTKVEYFGKTPAVKDIDESTSPYWRSGATIDLRTRIKLSAIPCRMYETIYNLYFRNPQNNPYILNGKPEYNVFIPTKDGGPDSNLYELRYRNWEDDFLTTAVQTPQQGIAPLVGLTDRGATVTLTNEDGSVTRYKTNLDENGNVTGIETTDSSEPLLTQALIDAVSYGISIEDLRNVNAMQKWLELNLRKGYQYKDIIESRWGISISYNELDLPEFIGGFTQEVGLQAVTQTTSHGEGIEGALGWQAGRMYAAGSGRSITHYCDEEGYIMALLTVVPVPNYSQLLPKHWFTRDLLDSYQPEFNHIGFQPITYKEVCPIQAYQESTENVDVLEQTFGYQRPWYEYFNQVDEVHGQFRTTFKDFLINRTFDVKPELSESFLLVDPNQVNDVFAVTTDDDKIIGAINHQITAKLPISLYAQARLE